MKKSLSMVLVGSLVAAGVAGAQERVVPTTQSTAVRMEVPVRFGFVPSAGAGKMERGAWLGVRTTHAPTVLLKQLKMKSGLVVESVEPKSPAEIAGLKENDLITKLDDQLLINPAQLAELIRQHEVGKNIDLTVLREGQELKVTPTLIEHDVPALTDADPSNWMPTDAQLANLGGPVKDFQIALRATDGKPMKFGSQTSNQTIRVVTRDGKMVDGYTVYRDNGREFTLTAHKDSKTLIVKDATGKELFNGPMNSPDDEAKLPEDLKGGYKSMQKMETHLELRAPEKPAGEEGL